MMTRRDSPSPDLDRLLDGALATSQHWWQSWRARRAAANRLKGPRFLLLWLGAAPLIPAALVALFAGRLDAFLADALAFSLFATATLIGRLGYRHGPEQAQRRFSRRWRLPLLNLAGVLTAGATAVVAIFGAGYTPAIGLAFGLVAGSGFFLVYGIQPWILGGRLSATDRASRLVSEALAEAENRLIEIEQAASALGNRELRARLARISALGRDILAQIAARPSDLYRARRFLSVFLEGAEQVSRGYLRTHQSADPELLEQRFRTVLVTIEDQFERQRARLTEADVLELDVQIEVLQKQLEHEGIR